MTLRLTARCVRGLEWLVAAEVASAAGGAAQQITFAERQVTFTVARADARWLGLRAADDLLLELGTLHGIDHTRAATAELSRQLAGIDFAAGIDVLQRFRSAGEEDARADVSQSVHSSGTQGPDGDLAAGTDTTRPTQPPAENDARADTSQSVHSSGTKFPQGDAASPTFDVVASLLGRRNYNRFTVEDAAGEVVAKALSARYVSRNPASNAGPVRGHASPTTSTRIGTPDFTVRVSLSGDTADVALRLSPRPLHRRPWKLDTGPGTLHPPLAAAFAMIGAGRGCVAAAFDPFCGDGTLAIETALAFPAARIIAGDLDADRLRNARANAARADVLSRVRFVQADAGRAAWRDRGFDLLVTNPPWNRAVGAAGSVRDSLDPFWRSAPDALAAHGRICTVAEAELDIPSVLRRAGYAIGLAQTVRLAGRVSHVVLAAPPRAAGARLPEPLAHWRERAIKAGIVSDDGF